MLKKYVGTTVIIFLFFFTSIALAEEPIPLPTRIAGSLRVLDITQITNTEYKEFVWSGNTLSEGFKIEVTRSDGCAYSGANTSELNKYDQYLINIPIKRDGDSDGDGAITGDTAVIHVYDKYGEEFQVKMPYNGEITVGEGGEINQVDLIVQKTCVAPCSEPKIYTQEDLDSAVNKERQKWDADNDSRIGLAEAIRALQIVSGIRSQP